MFYSSYIQEFHPSTSTEFGFSMQLPNCDYKFNQLPCTPNTSISNYTFQACPSQYSSCYYSPSYSSDYTQHCNSTPVHSSPESDTTQVKYKGDVSQFREEPIKNKKRTSLTSLGAVAKKRPAYVEYGK